MGRGSYVQSGHTVTPGQQGPGQGGAAEPGGSGDERLPSAVKRNPWGKLVAVACIDVGQRIDP